MWDPNPWAQQRPSFAEPVAAPSSAPCDPPLVCFSVNQEWLPYILGGCMQLAQPTTWIAADTATLEGILGRVTDLLACIGTAVPCSSQLPAVGPGGTAQACNIAGYLAIGIIKSSMQKAIDAIQASQTVLGYGMIILSAIPGGAGIFAFLIKALDGLYNAMVSGTLTHYQDAVSDATLFPKVACAIYTAISAQGMVTDANFPTLVSNVAAVSYTHADVITAIVNYLNDTGASGVQSIQAPGVMASYDCSGCGGGGVIIGADTLPPLRQSGSVLITISAGNSDATSTVTFPEPFPSPPIITIGCDSEDLIATFIPVDGASFVARIAAAVAVVVDTGAHVYWQATLPGAL